MREADNTGVLLLGWRLVSPPFFLIMKRGSKMKTTSGGRHRSPLTRIATQHTLSHSRGAFRPRFAWSLHPLSQEGAGKAGCRLAPAVRCAKSTRRKTAQQHTGVANHSAFPARWLDGLCRALPGAEFLLASLTRHFAAVFPALSTEPETYRRDEA